MTTPTNPPAKHPPRVWIKEPDADFLRMQNLGPEHEWLHRSEHTALLQEERARAFEEAAAQIAVNVEWYHSSGLVTLFRNMAQAARSPDCNNRLNQGEKEPEVKAARSPGDAEKGE